MTDNDKLKLLQGYICLKRIIEDSPNILQVYQGLPHIIEDIKEVYIK